MKTTSILSIAPLLPLAQALVGLGWGFAEIPSTGLTDITFPISIANAPEKTGFYFAQQFGFMGLSDVGYIGLQPRPHASGASIVHAAFSSFVSGTTTDDDNCYDGADGGPGVSCSIEIPAPYSPLYHLVVKNTKGTTWTGTLVDTVDGNSTHIGSWTLPAGSGAIQATQMGFIEYYPWNGMDSHSCDSLPYTNVTFGTPTSDTAGAGVGQIGKPYEYGDCVGEVKFDVQETSGGFEASLGF